MTINFSFVLLAIIFLQFLSSFYKVLVLCIMLAYFLSIKFVFCPL